MAEHNIFDLNREALQTGNVNAYVERMRMASDEYFANREAAVKDWEKQRQTSSEDYAKAEVEQARGRLDNPSAVDPVTQEHVDGQVSARRDIKDRLDHDTMDNLRAAGDRVDAGESPETSLAQLLEEQTNRLKEAVDEKELADKAYDAATLTLSSRIEERSALTERLQTIRQELDTSSTIKRDLSETKDRNLQDVVTHHADQIPHPTVSGYIHPSAYAQMKDDLHNQRQHTLDRAYRTEHDPLVKQRIGSQMNLEHHHREMERQDAREQAGYKSAGRQADEHKQGVVDGAAMNALLDKQILDKTGRVLDVESGKLREPSPKEFAQVQETFNQTMKAIDAQNEVKSLSATEQQHAQELAQSSGKLDQVNSGIIQATEQHQVAAERQQASAERVETEQVKTADLAHQLQGSRQKVITQPEAQEQKQMTPLRAKLERNRADSITQAAGKKPGMAFLNDVNECKGERDRQQQQRLVQEQQRAQEQQRGQHI